MRSPHAGVAVVALATSLVGCGAPRAPRLHAPEFLRSPETEALALPFSDAVRVGDMLYLSGQVGTRPGTLELVAGGIRAQGRQALENVRAILERHGSSMSRVVKCTIFLADIADWPAFNAVYAEFFPSPPPARSALGANGLALGARVEVECLAVGAPVGCATARVERGARPRRAARSRP